MKLLSCLFIFFSLSLSIPAIGQKSKNGDKIIALKLKKEYALKFHKGFAVQGFSVDKDGVLRPDKNYEIVILKEKKQFLVKPIDIDHTTITYVDTEEMPDGSTMVCTCGLGAGDNCAIGETQTDESTYWSCTGNCECGQLFFDSEYKVAEYQTMSGN